MMFRGVPDPRVYSGLSYSDASRECIRLCKMVAAGECGAISIVENLIRLTEIIAIYKPNPRCLT